jgi:hypothetical protein
LGSRSEGDPYMSPEASLRAILDSAS